MSAPSWFFVGLLAGVTATSIAIPLWRGVGRAVTRPLVYVSGGIAVFAAVAVGLYFGLGSLQQKSDSPSTHPGANVSGPEGTALSMEEATAQLQARLDRNGGSANDWQLLAQSYDFLGRTEDAKRAREHAGIPAAQEGTESRAAAPLPLPSVADLEKLGAGTARDAQGWADYADTLGTRNHSLAGEPAEAIDKALALDPANPKALWLKASLAHEQHRYAEALGIWRKLRSVLPADSSDVALVDANIAEAARLAGDPAKASKPTASSDRPAW